MCAFIRTKRRSRSNNASLQCIRCSPSRSADSQVTEHVFRNPSTMETGLKRSTKTSNGFRGLRTEQVLILHSVRMESQEGCEKVVCVLACALSSYEEHADGQCQARPDLFNRIDARRTAERTRISLFQYITDFWQQFIILYFSILLHCIVQ
jgi:hypothetical protein